MNPPNPPNPSNSPKKKFPKKLKISVFHMINYFAVLRLVFLRDNQTSYQQSETCFKNAATWIFQIIKNFENRINIRDSRASRTVIVI